MKSKESKGVSSPKTSKPVSPVVRLKDSLFNEQKALEWRNTEMRNLCVMEATTIQSDLSWFRWRLEEMKKDYLELRLHDKVDVDEVCILILIDVLLQECEVLENSTGRKAR
jgi:hypothetical protein